MPSLKVKRLQEKELSQSLSNDTFHHCYQSLVSDVQTQAQPLGCLFLKTISSVVFINFAIYSVTVGVWQMAITNFQVTYETYKLRYGMISMMIINQLINTSILIFIFFNHYWQYSLTKIFLVCFIVNVIMTGSILIVSSIEYKESDQFRSHHLGFICNTNYQCISQSSPNADLFDSMCPIVFSHYYIYYRCIYQPFSLLLVIITNQCLRIISVKFSINHNYILSINAMSNNDDSISREMVLLSDTNNLSTSELSSDVTDVDEMEPSKCDRCFVTFVVFGIVWWLFIWCNYVIGEITYYCDNLAYYFYALLSITSVFKFGLKQIARRIDIYSLNDNIGGLYHKRICKICTCDFIHSMSLEIMVEFVVNLVYYIWFYEVLILELAMIDDISIFIKITILHVLSEICQTVIRFSNHYFHITSIILQKFISNKCLPKLIVLLLQDESTFDEWRTRHAIDMAVRVVSFISSFIIVFVYIVANVYTFNKQQYDRTVEYFLQSFGVDVAYFSLVFVVNYCNLCKKCGETQFNVWKPFLMLFAANYKALWCLFFVGIGFCRLVLT